eukprot:2167088-Rhodomonas_salina.2
MASLCVLIEKGYAEMPFMNLQVRDVRAIFAKCAYRKIENVKHGNDFLDPENLQYKGRTNDYKQFGGYLL